MIIGEKPDRKIERIYALIATDPKTGMQGICGFGRGVNMQAASSNRTIIEKVKGVILAEPGSAGYSYEIVEFVRK